MATWHRFAGHRVFIYSNDHDPAHVHVQKAENEAKFLLNCPKGPVTLASNRRFTRAEITMIEAELNSLVKEFCAEWSAWEKQRGHR